ncbi:unnamed protein product [Coccothraustes coccothraustes]
MQVLRHAEDNNRELSGSTRLSRAAFCRSRALESTATGTMLSARGSRFFASGSRTTRPLLRREKRRSTTLAFPAQPSNPSRTAFISAPRCKKLDERKGNCWAKFSVLAQFFLVRKSGKAFGEDAGAQTRRRQQSGALRINAPVAGSFLQEPRFGEHSYRHNAQCARKPLLRLREPESTAAAET